MSTAYSFDGFLVALFGGEVSVPALPQTRYRPHAVYCVGK